MKIKYVFFAFLIFFVSCEQSDRSTSVYSSKFNSDSIANDQKLDKVLKSTNELVVSAIPVTKMFRIVDTPKISSLGSVGYDFRQVGILSSRVEGRIERLYVRSRFQLIRKGDPVYDIYSPELFTSQQNLIFLLRNDANNSSLIQAAKERLLLFGMTTTQLLHIAKTGKAYYAVPVFSNYTGYVTEKDYTSQSALGSSNISIIDQGTINNATATSNSLSIKEGTYLQKGQQVFAIVNRSKVAVSVNLNVEDASGFQRGSIAEIYIDDSPEKKIKSTIDHIDPFFKNGSKTLSATIYLNNMESKIPIGSRVKALVYGRPIVGNWLPAQAVIFTGLKHIVYKKNDIGYSPLEVFTGVSTGDKIQILSGLNENDSLAINAQQLVGNESIIKSKK